MALATDYQPDIYWMLDNDIYINCPETSNYCVENEDFQIVQLTRSKFTIEGMEENTLHSVTCFVDQDQNVKKTATLVVENGTKLSSDMYFIK